MPAINMHCDFCNSEQTFIFPISYIYGNYPSAAVEESKGRILRIPYLCAGCKKQEYIFLLRIDANLRYIEKVGQYPPWSISINKNLAKILGKYKEIYKKGLINESQGYGIGAFAYYRRIIENIIDELLDSIPELMGEKEKKEYIEALEKTKTTKDASEKIKLIIHVVPEVLKPQGFNPFKMIHEQLSIGIHVESDEACLELAKHLRKALIFIVDNIIRNRESKRDFTEAMKKVLDKKK